MDEPQSWERYKDCVSWCTVQARKSHLLLFRMLRETDTRDPLAVAGRIRRDYLGLYPEGDRLFVPQVFGWAIDCFTGRHPEYQAIDARYHDLEHTLQGALCLSGLLCGRQLSGDRPALEREQFELATLAILFHDTGYLKRRSDNVGTGAKYTATHVQRSCEFAAEFLSSKGYSPAAIRSVQNMIRCTGMNANVAAIPFQNEMERLCGFALGTADLLGQMAAPDYVDKLPTLYEEFLEAGRFNGNPGAVGFASVEDLVRKTPGFWEKYVLPKISTDFGGLFHFLAPPGANGVNEYLAHIEANIARIRRLTGIPVPAPAI